MNAKTTGNIREAITMAKIRQLNKLIPVLVKARYLGQASETKKAVLAALKPSQNFMSTVNDFPPNHLEQIISIYQDVILRAYTEGQDAYAINAKKIAQDTLGMVIKEQINVYVHSNFKIAEVICDELCSLFRLNTAKYMESIDSADDIYLAVQEDLNKFYCKAIIDAVVILNEDTLEKALGSNKIPQDSAKEKVKAGHSSLTALEEYALLLGPKHEAVLRATLGLPPRKISQEAVSETLTGKQAQASTTRSLGVNNSGQNATKEKTKEEKSPLTALEEYAMLLGPKHEAVLRATLGLSPRKINPGTIPETATDKQVYASVNSKKVDDLLRDLLVTAAEEDSEEDISETISYNPDDLRSTVLDLVNAHQSSDKDADLDFVIVDCIAPEADDLSDDVLLAGLKEKLKLAASNWEELEKELKDCAAKLSAEVGLPGEFMFSEIDGDFCLVFTFTKEAAAEMAVPKTATAAARSKKILPKEKKRKTVGDLPETEDNLIPQAHQVEIKQLNNLGGQFKNASLRDLRKASPTLSALISGVFSLLRSGKITMGEAAKRFFGASNEALIEEAFGSGGKNYYAYLRGR